jgi:AraC family transcriptional regulator
MEMLADLNRALDLVEVDTDQPVDVAAMARIAAVSEHHLRRLFATLARMSISEYARKRRLSLAAAEVISSSDLLLDIAVRYGYGSGEAFARAFRAQHGINPSDARRNRPLLTLQPRIAFRLTIEGADEMRYRIVEKPAWRLAGYHARLPIVYHGANTAMEEFTRGLGDEAWEKLDALPQEEPTGVLAVSTGFTPEREDGSLFDYWMAVATTAPTTDGMAELAVDAGTWLILPFTDRPYPEAIQQLWVEAYADWFPAHPTYQATQGPEILKCDWSADETTASGELWLPVVRTN